MDEPMFIEAMKTDFPDFKVMMSNLTHPTTEFVVSYYTTMLDATLKHRGYFEFNERQVEFLNMHQNEGVAMLHHARIQSMLKTLRFIFSKAMSYEFTFSDLLCPELSPKRTFIFMTLFLDIYAYCGKCDYELEEKMQGCSDEREQLNKLTIEKDELERKLIKCERDRELYVRQTEELTRETAKYNAENVANQNLLKEMYMKLEHKQKQVAKNYEEEQDLQAVSLKLDNEIKHLQSLIVSDQNQVLETHRLLSLKKEELTRKVDQLRGTLEATTLQNNQFELLTESQQKANSFLCSNISQGKVSDFMNLHNVINDLNKQLEHQKSDCTSLSADIIDVEKVIAKQKQEEAQINAELASIANKEKTRIGKLMEYIDCQKRDFSSLHNTLVDLQSKHQDDKEQVQSLTSQCLEWETKLQQMDQENIDKYNQFKATINNVYNSLEKKLRI